MGMKVVHEKVYLYRLIKDKLEMKEGSLYELPDWGYHKNRARFVAENEKKRYLVANTENTVFTETVWLLKPDARLALSLFIETLNNKVVALRTEQISLLLRIKRIYDIFEKEKNESN